MVFRLLFLHIPYNLTRYVRDTPLTFSAHYIITVSFLVISTKAGSQFSVIASLANQSGGSAGMGSDAVFKFLFDLLTYFIREERFVQLHVIVGQN